MIAIILMLMISISIMAPVEKVFYLERPEEINYYDRLIKAIIAVESNGNVYAFNYMEQAAGPMQIRPCRINHYNQLAGSNYIISDCFDLELSRKVFLYFTQGRSYEVIARAWCSGEAGTKAASEGYYLLIQKELLSMGGYNCL